jgi:hypothetical protein
MKNIFPYVLIGVAIGGFGFGALLAYYANNACDYYFQTCYSYIPATNAVTSISSKIINESLCVSFSGGTRSNRYCTQQIQRNYWIGVANFDTCVYSPQKQFESQQEALNYMTDNYLDGRVVQIGIMKSNPSICIKFDEGISPPKDAAIAFVVLVILGCVCFIGGFACLCWECSKKPPVIPPTESPVLSMTGYLPYRRRVYRQAAALVAISVSG